MIFRPTLCAACALTAIAASAAAETVRPVDEVVVTGSRIAATVLESPSPIAVIGAYDFVSSGYLAGGDIIRLLPANVGSEFNADVFTQNLSVGTSNFNLRGLGLNATLVLLNGRRQTVSGGIADDGSAFVDLNALIPMIALQRTEVLKDGASALYGTDAIAGVANFMTKTGVRGITAQIDYANTARSSQHDWMASLLAGTVAEKFETTAAVSYLRRSWLPTPERDFTAGKAFSSFGQPGAYILLQQSPIYPDIPFGLNRNIPIIDPDCTAGGGIRNAAAQQPAGMTSATAGTCLFDFSGYYHLVPRERRWNAFGSGTVEVNDTMSLYGESAYAHNTALRGTSPSFPILNLPTITATNPGNIFQTPVLFLGRPFGVNAPVNLVDHVSETWRAVGGAKGTIGDWTWDASLSQSANRFVVNIDNVLADRFLAALACQGGPNNNLCFNPFGSAATAQPGSALFNDPAVTDDFASTLTYDYRTRLTVADVSAMRPVFTMPAGSVELALGAQFRHERITGDHDEQYNRENYLFFIGGPDFAGTRDVWAAFGEARVPLADTFDVQLALRHENYEGGVSSTDPKIAALWRPTDTLALRGSFSTSFRAPSVFQVFSVQTVLSDLIDPITGVRGFRGVRTIGAPDLKPERANVANAGLTWSPIVSLSLSVDYWRFDYTDIIVKQGAQAIIDANPNDPRIVRQAGQIVRVDAGYVNAPSALTDGLDLNAMFDLESAMGRWRFSADATWINQFLIQDVTGGPRRDVSGSRNFRTFARSLPRWRGQFGARWALDRHSAAVTARFVDSYRDDQNVNRRIDSQKTVDVQYRYQFPNIGLGTGDGPALSVGAINLFDKDPPDVITNAGFDSKIHDPRGRVVYLRVNFAY